MFNYRSELAELH